MKKLIPLLLIAGIALAHLAEVVVTRVEPHGDHTDIFLNSGQMLEVDAVITNSGLGGATLKYKQAAGTNWLVFMVPMQPPVKIAIPPLRTPIEYDKVHYH